jgi:hypothetical protein
MIHGYPSPRHALMGRLVGAMSAGQALSPADIIAVTQGLPPGIGNPGWPNLPPGIAWPNGLNFQNGPVNVQPRVYPLSIASNGTIAPGATQVLTARAQAAFKPERFVVPSTIAPNFLINSIKIGARPQTVDGADTGIPAEVFSEVAQNNLMSFDSIQPGIDLYVTVTNLDTQTARAFRGTFIGPALVP